MKILAIGAHPDDIALCCSGTLKKCVDRGDEVVICTVSNGNLGSTTIEPDALGLVRIKEDNDIARVIGATTYINLNINDQFVDSKDINQVNALVSVIRRAQPDLIITHSPDDYHLDHRETYLLTFRASCAASLHFWKWSGKEAAMCPIYLMDSFALKNFEPTEYVDISDVIDMKKNLMPIYESQYEWMRDHDNLDLCEYVEACAKVRGYQCGMKYAEGFKPDINYGRMSTKRFLP